MKRRIALGLSALLLIAGCSKGSSPSTTTQPKPAASSFPMTITDDDGAQVTIAEQPERIVTFAPSDTEIVFALGLGPQLVGVSGSYDDYPPGADRVERIGGSGDFGQNPNEERVVALSPDLMLTISGGEQWKERLRGLGVPVFTINATDFDDLLHDIRTVGALTGATAEAEALTDQMAARAGEIQKNLSAEPAVSCFFEAYYPPLTTVGPHTFISDVLARAGCRSVSGEARSDYP